MTLAIVVLLEIILIFIFIYWNIVIPLDAMQVHNLRKLKKHNFQIINILKFALVHQTQWNGHCWKDKLLQELVGLPGKHLNINVLNNITYNRSFRLTVTLLYQFWTNPNFGTQYKVCHEAKNKFSRRYLVFRIQKLQKFILLSCQDLLIND